MRMLVLLLLSFRTVGQPMGDGSAMLKKMYDRWHGRWHNTLTFTQHTEFYRNDSLTGTQTWYETIMYPGYFRIDFDAPAEGNCIIYRSDSAYLFRKGVLAKSQSDRNDLLYTLGGMYFSPSFAHVTSRFTAMRYDLTKGFETVWNGKPVVVIGAENEIEHTNQLWVETTNYNIVRFVKYDGGSKEEGVLAGHTQLNNGGWCETEVSFYANGKLVQKERYSEMNTSRKLNPLIFSPATPWVWHWLR